MKSFKTKILKINPKMYRESVKGGQNKTDVQQHFVPAAGEKRGS